jgi:hypothetical protein
LVTVPITLEQAVNSYSHYFLSSYWLVFQVFWNRFFVTVPIILDEAVVYFSHHFGSGSWLLFPSF